MSGLASTVLRPKCDSTMNSIHAPAITTHYPQQDVPCSLRLLGIVRMWLRWRRIWGWRLWPAHVESDSQDCGGGDHEHDKRSVFLLHASHLSIFIVADPLPSSSITVLNPWT